jgi:hypothetical protein
MSKTGDDQDTPATDPSPDEPTVTRLTFERDPLGAARATLFHLARARARAGARSAAEALAREATAVELARLRTPDDDVRDAGSQPYFSTLSVLAETPAANLGDVACKLAMAMQALAGQSRPEAVDALLNSALADLALLRAGPITLPERAESPIVSAEDVAYWRRADAQAGQA